ncbi:guanylate kinase [Desulfohalobiaceae bacterium Ax17]|jgi:guanylate kinase|uniref:guanylate kinase n=1 Tax=Desulfovulcanus ferrireducens TaxID=2831190 RepID=UPI00207BC544|nr:guanylate kinase [Desulfovulcanus ferrireducens]MBT8763575.1 guanylate kinase [Desulfovulcanus ferrireducens]
MKKNSESKGLLLVISAPSGTGKSTLISMLRKDFPELNFSISYTTRKPRPGEVHGRDYFFVSKDEFLRLKQKDFFAEWALVHSNFYGTPKEMTLRALQQGQDLVFDIDVQGARQLKESLGLGCYVFIFPPSFEALKERLQKRGTDDEKTIAKRLENAKAEISQSHFFDYWLINDDLNKAYEQLRSIVVAEKLRPCFRPHLPENILKQE